jgi:trk system potassium uptake protein TrkA
VGACTEGSEGRPTSRAEVWQTVWVRRRSAQTGHLVRAVRRVSVLIIVGGCGYVGSAIAERLASEPNDDVVVIDNDPRAFDRLTTAFNGETVTGSVTDRDVLERAGIADADGMIAVTRSDNTNLMAVQIATHLYKVPRTVARLFNPDNEHVYRKLGVAYVSSTGTIAKLFMNEFREDAFPLHVLFDAEDVSVVDLTIDSGGHGMTVAEFERQGPVRLSAVQRAGRIFIPDGTERLEAGDVITTALRISAADGLHGLIRELALPAADDADDVDDPNDDRA